MNEKKLIVVNGMTGQEMPVKVLDEATPGNVVQELGLDGYSLARVSDRKPLQPTQVIGDQVRDGERLFAFSPMTVGGA